MLDRRDRLPAPQRDALGSAFGLTPGIAADRFLVGLAVLGLLADVAEEQPLLCVVEDAQWLDQASAQALAIAARRLYAESVVMLVAIREPCAAPEFQGLPELRLEGLPARDARELLASVTPGGLDERVRDRIVAETHGNPLALLELPRGPAAAERAAGFGAAAPAVADGLVELGARIDFRHPLVRSAVYGAASPEEPRTLHGAIADAIDPGLDSQRRAWHRAHAAPGPDEVVAGELERTAAAGAQGRGSVVTAGVLLERAVALTPDPRRRAERALAAAQASLDAGAATAASGLLDAADEGLLDELGRARLERMRARIAFVTRRGHDAPPLLITAARRLEALDIRLARETYLEALDIRLAFAASLGSGRSAPCSRATTSAGFSPRCGSRGSCGTTTSGSPSPCARCSAPVTPARSPCSPSLSASWPGRPC